MPINYYSKTKPLPHQIEAIEAIAGAVNSVALFDEQGLGKTKIIIDALCEDMEKKIIGGVLVVCKKTLLNTWKQEIIKHSNLRPNIILGTRSQRGMNFLNGAQFHIINYDAVIQESSRLQSFLKLKKYAIVLDESQKIKNPKSKTATAIFAISNLATKRIIITGTPMANRPQDLWTQYKFLDDGKTLGTDFESFKKKFEVKLKGQQNLSIYQEKLKWLRNTLQTSDTIFIRRLKNILNLPGKEYRNIGVDLVGDQKKIYDRLREKLYLEIKKASGEQIEKQINNYLEKLLRLIQVASNPGLINDNFSDTPVKFIEIDKLVDTIIKNNEKVIIWSCFVDNIKAFKIRYKHHGSLTIFGEMIIEDRNKAVELFMTSSNHKILIANPAAAKEGLTLTEANHAIYLDRNFNLDDYLQSQDRIHRIGQKRKCYIYKILANNTVDEYVDEILEKKHILAKFTMGDTKRITHTKEFLSKEDLLRIIG